MEAITLEQKVQEFLSTKSRLQVLESEEEEELEPLQAQIATIRQSICAVQEKRLVMFDAANSRIAQLKSEILTGMTEKTHKFDCATVTKKVTKGLKIVSPLKLFQKLQEINLSDLVALPLKNQRSFKRLNWAHWYCLLREKYSLPKSPPPKAWQLHQQNNLDGSQTWDCRTSLAAVRQSRLGGDGGRYEKEYDTSSFISFASRRYREF